MGSVTDQSRLQQAVTTVGGHHSNKPLLVLIYALIIVVFATLGYAIVKSKQAVIHWQVFADGWNPNYPSWLNTKGTVDYPTWFSMCESIDNYDFKHAPAGSAKLAAWNAAISAGCTSDGSWVNIS